MTDEDCQKITKEDLTVIGLAPYWAYLPRTLTFKSLNTVVSNKLQDYFTSQQSEHKCYSFEKTTFRSVNPLNDRGWFEVICKNVDTVEWITSLRFDSQTRFTKLSDVYEHEENESFIYFRCQNSGVFFDCRRALLMIEKQNVGLKTDSWELIIERPIEKSNDTLVLYSVKNDSIDYFRKRNWEIHVAMDKCEVKQFHGFLHESFTDQDILKAEDFSNRIIWSDFIKMLKETHRN